MSGHTIHKKMVSNSSFLNEMSSIRSITNKQKPGTTSLISIVPEEEDSKLQDSFSRLDQGISEKLKTRQPRCCAICKKPGHLRNKCPEIMAKNLIPTSELHITEQTIQRSSIHSDYNSLKSGIKSIKPASDETHHTPVKTNSFPAQKSTAEGSIRPPPTPRTEVQAHGKIWEIDILVNVYGADAEKIKKSGYTDIYDLKAEDNKLDDCNLSVKTTGSGTVYMGDCLRIYNSVSSAQPYHLVVINYSQRGSFKHVTKIQEFDMTGLKHDLFGTLTLEQITQLASAVKAIPQKRSPTPDERKALYDLKKILQPQSGIIGLDIKCNSTQSRLQCSISSGRFKGLLAKYPDRIIATSNTNEFRSGSIREFIPSEIRKLKKKDKTTVGTLL